MTPEQKAEYDALVALNPDIASDLPEHDPDVPGFSVGDVVTPTQKALGLVFGRHYKVIGVNNSMDWYDLLELESDDSYRCVSRGIPGWYLLSATIDSST
jgi:hypothetical protein